MRYTPTTQPLPDPGGDLEGWLRLVGLRATTRAWLWSPTLPPCSPARERSRFWEG